MEFLHKTFVTIEEMTPNEDNGVGKLLISYSFTETPFGQIIIASTSKGICYLAFVDDKNQALQMLQKTFPAAHYEMSKSLMHQNAAFILKKGAGFFSPLVLHIKGTPFQLKVWNALLGIPFGQLTNYRSIAEQIGHPKASRAAGSAVGENPIAILIPCHRVILSTGLLGEYHWGSVRKAALIEWEKNTSKVNFVENR